MKLKYLSLILPFVVFSFQVSAQCCAAGNPVSGEGGGNAGKNVLKISTLYTHSYSDTYFNGTEKSDFEYKTTYFDFSLLSLSYGISERLNFKSELGYFYNKSEDLVLSGYHKKANGIGDASFSLSYVLFKKPEKSFRLTPLFTLKAPVGEFDQVYQNVVLPIDLQPSSGSFRYTPALAIYKGFNYDKISIISFLSVEFAQTINSERAHYKYGNLYLISFIGNYNINKDFMVSLHIREQIREYAYNYNQTTPRVDATGGNLVFLSPQLSYNKNSWNVSAKFDYPFYKNLNTDGLNGQLSNKYAFSLTLSRSLDLNKKPKTPFLEEGVEYKTDSFFVDGICGMCKDRIQNSALTVKEVEWAEWNLDTKTLTIKYRDEVDLEKLHEIIAKVGHDTEKIKATDKAYNKLHSCCKYRDLK